MRIINNHKCSECCYFDPDNNYCQADDDYKTVSPTHYACKSFVSDADDFDINSYYNNDFDENNYSDYDEDNIY